MGQTEVTQEAYTKVTKQNPSNFKSPKNPVESISWDDAQKYCLAVGLRLPTEAEWEYAARAGSKEARYGSLDRVAWTGSGTTAVASKDSNAWQLFDMLGNVWEWTADWYDADYYKKSPALDPKGPVAGTTRVLRGGCWNDNPRYVRVSRRFRYGPTYRYNLIGFRCAGELR